MMTNKFLHIAKKEKNDEFYTPYNLTESELANYEGQLRDKVVYCKCDKPYISNFHIFLEKNKKTLGIKDILISDDDFRLQKNIDRLKNADIVITNPPFSLFREFYAILNANNKDFLVICNVFASRYKIVFEHLKSGKNKTGVNYGYRNFQTPSGISKRLPMMWLTTLQPNNKKPLTLTKKNSDIDYQQYDNYGAINIDKLDDIPMDFHKPMGVPISFARYMPNNDFELVESPISLSVNGKQKFARFIIQRKPTTNSHP